jgi:alkanesulfonate monooxygenase SsuD/methylene tetrahydromethanopterin reductase-like flavin-dependent oxidoreductase (luciferase family)
LEPSPKVPPPVVVGGRSEAALRRAARTADGWLGVWMSPRRVREARHRLDDLAAEYGRPPVAALLMVFVHVTDDLAAGHAEAAAFVRGQYGLPYASLERWVIVGDEAHVAARLSELRAAGVEGFVLVAAASDPLGQYRRLAAARKLIDI